MAKNKPNRPLNQSFQKGCARLRYTTFDNISRGAVSRRNSIERTTCPGVQVEGCSRSRFWLADSVRQDATPRSFSALLARTQLQPVIDAAHRERYLIRARCMSRRGLPPRHVLFR